MPRRSRYDDLHDRYHQILTTKAGTRYERLTALVFKALDDQNTVIHDLKLSGEDPEVKHQIDVDIELPGIGARRVLIECKDFDVGDKPVGIGIVRDFRSVIEDTKADLGIIITCIGFTGPAKKYAQSKGIKLCIMRIAESDDLKGRIESIVLRLIVEERIVELASIYLNDVNNRIFEDNLKKKNIGSTGIGSDDPVYFVKDTTKEQFCDFLYSKLRQKELWITTKDGALAILPNDWAIQVDDLTPVEFEGIVLDVKDECSEESLKLTSDRIAELILEGFGSTDLFIFGDQIERFQINPKTGAVEAIQ